MLLDLHWFFFSDWKMFPAHRLRPRSNNYLLFLSLCRWYFAITSLSGVMAVTFSIVFAYVADITSREERGTAYGLVNTWLMISFYLAVLLPLFDLAAYSYSVNPCITAKSWHPYRFPTSKCVRYYWPVTYASLVCHAAQHKKQRHIMLVGMFLSSDVSAMNTLFMLASLS